MSFIDSNQNISSNLLIEESEQRFKTVSNVSYSIELNINKQDTKYKATTKINFNFKPNETDTCFLDFVGSEIFKITLNEKVLDKSSGVIFDSHRLFFPSALLSDYNSLVVEYENNYDTTGQGFHRFVDPEDDQVYLYTNFEPFDAHRLFPCFDQPDLKATFSLVVSAPDDWIVLSCSKLATKEKEEENGISKNYFPPMSKPFSTYIFAIVAGPFQSFKDITEDGIELGFHCRKSMAKFLDYNELFTITKHGMKFYQQYFDYKYPWENKYDQIFVPEFNLGAMENTSCIVHSEYMLYREIPTLTQRVSRADTILHELAHQWFGNLVTMHWWEGLWLNESFATYMAAVCTADLSLFPSEISWLQFNSCMKAWAYREDQLCTTHSIQCQVPDTESTFLNFDGITYGKGAAVLKQLVFAIGDKSFRNGMKIYFKRHEFKNAKLSDFLQALEDGNDTVDLAFFSKEWLLEAGLNTLEPKYTVNNNNKIDNFDICQYPPNDEHPTLRSHHLEIALYNKDGSIDNVVKSKICGEITKIESLIGKNKPHLCFINHNDNAYAKIMLDHDSLQFAKLNLNLFKNALTRQQLYRCFWDMVRDAKISFIDYVDIAIKYLPSEPDNDLIASIISNLVNGLSRFISKCEIPKQANKLFNMAKNQVLLTKCKGDAGITWARFACRIGGKNLENVKELILLLQDKELVFDQDMKWIITTHAIGWNLPESEILLFEQINVDGKTDRGAENILTCQAANPDKELKSKIFQNLLVKNNDQSLHLAIASMSGFYWDCIDESIFYSFEDDFFSVIVNVFKNNDREYARNFFKYMYPKLTINKHIQAQTINLLSLIDEKKDVIFHRMVKEAIDDIGRALRCQTMCVK